VTPSQQTQPLLSNLNSTKSTSLKDKYETPKPLPEHFTLAHKAERILGLQPGTLSHAIVCLENARDEVRRTSLVFPPPIEIGLNDGNGSGVLEKKEGGMKNRMFRAKRVMSVALPSGVGMNIGLGGLNRSGSVVVGTGGREEKQQREKRRRAADGVLYWQKEVARLESEEIGRR